MTKRKQKQNTCLFIGFLALAAIANLVSRICSPVLNSLLTVLYGVILTGLLLFWIQSVRIRLLPSAARTSTLAAAFLMLLYELLRIFKYHCSVDPVLMRWIDYAYWIPQTLIPALFLITFVRIWYRRNETRSSRETPLLIPAALLAFTVMTNDLHHLVYRPTVALSDFVMISGTYTLGPVFYLLYAWMLLTLVCGLVLMLRNAGHLPKKAIRDLLAVMMLWTGIVLFNTLFLYRYTIYKLLTIVDTHIFGMLGMFEVCIRYRLIPYNENYAEFYRKLHFPSVITDRKMNPVYHTDAVQQADLWYAPASQAGLRHAPALQADRQHLLRKQYANLQAALETPVSLQPDQELYGKEIRGGYAFWTVDKSNIHKAQKRLSEANETIEQENDLLRAETEQKKKDAYLASRHRIYHEIAAELYPVQKRIEQLLDTAQPRTESFPDTIAKVSVLNAYVKRKTNLLLLAAESESLQLKDLFLALQESAGYLTLAGLTTKTAQMEDAVFRSRRIISLYDAFESIAEQLLGKASLLMVSWNKGVLRLAAETEETPETGNLTVSVTFHKNETILYMDIRPGKEAV